MKNKKPKIGSSLPSCPYIELKYFLNINYELLREKLKINK